MVQFKIFLYALLAVMTLFAGSASAQDAPIKTRLLYFSSFPEIRQENNAPGLAELASALRIKRTEVTNSYFIDGGASLGPSVLGAMDAGAHMIDLLNALDPTLMAVGKKEFSYGYDQFVVNALAAAFPVVTSNLVDTTTGMQIDTAEADFFLESDAMNIGFIALTSPNAIREYGARQARSLDDSKTVMVKSAQLRAEGADTIILLADTDYDDLSSFQEDGIVDVIFYAHNFNNRYSIDHQGQKHSEGALDNKLIVLDLWHEQTDTDARILRSEASFVDISLYPPDPIVGALVQSYQGRLDRLLGPELATLTFGFDTYRNNIRSKENAFANLVTMAMRAETGADVALLNAGSIRGNTLYTPGQTINRGNIQRELPFENRTTLVRISGANLRSALEHGVSCGLVFDGCFVHFDNIYLTYDSDRPAGNRITHVRVGHAPLDDSQSYTVATSDFIAMGNDGFSAFSGAEYIPANATNELIWSLVAQYIKNKGVVAVQTDGRLRSATAIEQDYIQ